MDDYDFDGGGSDGEGEEVQVDFSRPVIYHAIQGCNRTNCAWSGFLQKKSRNRGAFSFSSNWNKRMFRFHEDLTLQYWADDQLKGEIKLDHLSKITKIDSASADGKPNVFTISNTKETMIFSAEMPEQVDAWISAVQSMINLPKKLERLTRVVGFNPQQPITLEVDAGDLDTQVTVSEWCEGKSYPEVFYDVYLTVLAKELELFVNRDPKAAEKIRSHWRSRKLILRSSMSKLASGMDHNCSFTSTGSLLIELKHARASIEAEYLATVFRSIQYKVYPSDLSGVLKDFAGTGDYKIACNGAFSSVKLDAEQGTMEGDAWDGDAIQRLCVATGFKTFKYNMLIINYSSGHGFRSSSNMDDVLSSTLYNLCNFVEKQVAEYGAARVSQVFAQKCGQQTLKIRCNLDDDQPPQSSFKDGFLRLEFPKHIAKNDTALWSVVFPSAFVDVFKLSEPGTASVAAEEATIDPVTETSEQASGKGAAVDVACDSTSGMVANDATESA